MSSGENLAEQAEIVAVMLLYASACDEKRWDLFDDVFVDDVQATYRGTELSGCEAIKTRISGLLDKCGVTQHLLANIQVDVTGDQAEAFCKVRGWHQGIGVWDGVYYEAFGHYRDHFLKKPEGWRIDKRVFVSEATLGTLDIFDPDAKAD
jgi:hypothetical protein